MTKQLIEITFGNAMKQADQLDTCADDMMRVANNRLAEIKSDIGGAWRGESADAYMQKMELTAANIVKTAKKLYKAAETIREVARIFRRTELRALELLQQKSV